MAESSNEQVLVYVGTYTGSGSEGIYVCRMDMSTGRLEVTGSAGGIKNPSYLAIHPQQGHLYAVNEVEEFDGKPSGAVSAFSIQQETGELTYLNHQSSHGTGPCHLSVDKTGRFVLVANYGSGSIAMLPVQDDGRLSEATDAIQHEGSSVNPERQKGPHAHSINLDADNRFAFVADLGLDRIMIYQLDLTQGKLRPNDEPWTEVTAGAGPRHFDFHPNGRYAYVINELDSTMSALRYDNRKGALEVMQTESTLPADFSGRSHCADVHVSPSGRFVYGSNRGHDSIVIFAIDEGTGRLTYVGHEPTQGETPRNFLIDPTGTFLLAANQNSGNIVTFRIDPQNGTLSPTGHVAGVPKPVCLKMITVT
ncbi:MAG: lactonase family protein [Dehalococcoidia bacterium]